jgi:type II restriction enzyme
MQQSTRQAVYQLLKSFARSSLKNYDIEKLKLAYPFHRIFFDEKGLLAFKLERSVVTRMGSQLYPQLALLIASDDYADVEREKVINGELEEAAVNTIGRIVRELRAGLRKPNHEQETQEIENAKSGSRKMPVRIIADLYIGDYPQGPFFAEIKTPVPNLDICAEAKSKILTFESLMPKRNSRGYLAFAYNPYITREGYRHPFTKKVMDMDAEVLMAAEFWDQIGSKGTFAEMLQIIDLVGDEIQKSL